MYNRTEFFVCPDCGDEVAFDPFETSVGSVHMMHQNYDCSAHMEEE